MVIDYTKIGKSTNVLSGPYIDWYPDQIPECNCGLEKGYVIPPYSDDCTCILTGDYHLLIPDGENVVSIKLDSSVTDEQVSKANNYFLGEI